MGYNDGTITSSYATGAADVTGDHAQAGGLGGYNEGTITSVMRRERQMRQETAGGLVGVNYGTITSSYATGDATADVTGYSARAGGLVGYNEGHDHVQLCDGSGRCDRSTTPLPAAWWGITMARSRPVMRRERQMRQGLRPSRRPGGE